MEGFLGGLAILADPYIMAMVMLGTVLCIFVGALPGISGSTTIALLMADMPRARPACPFSAILYPSRAVALAEGSPGALTRIAVIEPPKLAAQ